MFIQRVIKSLDRHSVRYALVGGYAVALHGVIRGTVDINFVISLEKKSFAAAEKAMGEIGLKSRLPVSAEEVFSFREEYIRNRNLIAWSFYNPTNPLEVVDILITEDARKLHTVEKKVDRLRIVVASIPDLIRLKKQSARPQDIEDIKALEKIQ